jgi:uncharacterized protein YqjF (DUF2071 family)
MPERALVRNAADGTQVKYASKKEQDRDALFRAATEQVMHRPGGRLFVWTLLERLGVFRSVMDDRPRIQYNTLTAAVRLLRSCALS